MNKQLIVAAVGALILPLSFVAKADGVTGGTEFTVYGRVVAGVYRNDSDKDGESATWEIGGTGIDGGRLSGSRLGFNADRDLGNGMNVGFKLEQEFGRSKAVDADGNRVSDNSASIARHRYVYISGGFGRLSIGNDVGPMGNTSYDGSYFLGGNFRKGTDRRDGLHYSNSMGAFNFGLSVTGNEGDPSVGQEARVVAVDPDDIEAADISDAQFDAANRARAAAGQADYDNKAALATALNEAAEITTAEATAMNRVIDARNAIARESAGYRIADEDIDRTIIGAGYDFGAFAVNVGHDADNTDTDRDITALLVSGDVGPLHYKVGYEQQDDATKDGENDLTAVGLFLAYSVSENDLLYLEYESADDDHTPAGTSDTDDGGTATLLGYSHSFGGGAVFVAEYRATDNDSNNGVDEADPSRLALAMIVNF